MPSLFRLGPYIIFFWTGENGEPVHVHVAVKRPTAEATKIWLTRSGGCKPAHNKGDIPARDLRDIMQFISSNHALICKRWKETTAGCRFTAESHSLGLGLLALQGLFVRAHLYFGHV